MMVIDRWPFGRAAWPALSKPVDASSLAAFRVLFGVVAMVAMIRVLAKGWVETIYLEPVFHFPWFFWIKPWPGNGMYVHVWVLAMLALGIAVGFRYRLCTALFCLGFTYLELIDQTTYLNHYYLISLLSGLLIFLPANCQWSLDALRRRRLAAESVPAWTVWLLRYQMAVVFVFAGLAKLNPDWLFAAQPMRTWLMANSGLPLIGSWLAEPWVAFAASWFGALYDLTIPFLLLYSRTRLAALAAVVFFHVMTSLLFPIGMFPWLMIVASTVFLPYDWPRRFLIRKPARTSVEAFQRAPSPRLDFIPKFLLLSYCGLQILLPARSWFYPQCGAWDQRGFNFSWRVMLVEKTGSVEFYRYDPDGKLRERIPIESYTTPRQRVMMAQDPALIRQFAQFLSVALARPDSEIRAEAYAVLNGHPSQRLVRPDVNLAGALPPDWIVPFGAAAR
jgi:hypothetical protein